MKYFEKTWVKIVVCLLGGGILSELIHVFTGDPNRPKNHSMTLVFAGLMYLILTAVIKRRNNTL